MSLDFRGFCTPRARSRHSADMEIVEIAPLPESDTRDELEILVSTHQAMVWRYLRLLGADDNEADDLMQETFLRISRSASHPDAIRTPAAFLRGIARNLLLGHRRAMRRRVPTVSWLDSVDGLVREDPTALDDQRIDALRECQSKLRGKARLAVELHYMQGFSYRETAQRLGLRLNGLKALMQRTRQTLKACVTRSTRGDDES